VKKPNARKLGRFAFLTVFYGIVAASVTTFMAIHTCGMTPDYAATCDPTPINVTIVILGLLYGGFALAFFRAELTGKG
jgi:hypothetical protein